MPKKRSHNSGFTLIELLVVISIIGLLSSIALVGMGKARLKARDAKRLADMRQLQIGLDMYYEQNNNNYPNPDANQGGMCGGWNTSSYDPFITALKNSGVMSKVPVDPVNSGATGCGIYAYRYYRYGPNSPSCDPCKGKSFYVLGINSFETVGGSHPSSPGWKCVDSNNGTLTRDWQGEFSWVMGRCE